MLEKIIRYLYYALFFFTPLLMSAKTSEIFELNKMFFIYLMTILISMIWLIKCIIKKERFFKHYFIGFVLLFLAANIFSTIFSIDRHTSIFGYYGRFNGSLLSIIAYILLFVVFVQTFQKKDIPRFLFISLLSSVLVMLWGMPGRFGYDASCRYFTGAWTNSCWTNEFRPAERMFSTLGQPNWLGAYLAIHFFIGVYFFLSNSFYSLSPKLEQPQKKSKHQLQSEPLFSPVFLSYVFGGYIILNFVTILFTRSRSALLSIGIAFVAIAAMLFIQYKNLSLSLLKKYSWIIISLIAAVLIFKTGIGAIDKYLTFGTSTKTEQSITPPSRQTQNPQVQQVSDSLDIRKIVWKGAIDLGFKYPLFGTGVETFAYSYYFTRPNEHNLTSEWDFIYNKAHNEFLNYFATTGFIGLFAYLVLIVITFKIAYQSWKQFHTSTNEASQEELLIIALIGSYITIQVTNFFGFSTTTINLFFYLIPAFLLTFVKKEPTVQLEKKSSLSFFQWAQVSIVVIIASIFFINLSMYYTADHYYAEANTLIATGDYQNSIGLLDEALKMHYEHVYEDKLSYALANVSFIAFFQNEKELASSLRELSDGYNQRTLDASPKNVLYWKTRAKNYYIFYQMSNDVKDLQDALAAILIARELAPTDVKIMHSEAVFYVTMMEKAEDEKQKAEWRQKAIEILDYSMKLRPGYEDAIELKKKINGVKK